MVHQDASPATVNVNIDNNQQFQNTSPSLLCKCHDGTNEIACPAGSQVCANIVLPAQFKASPYTDDPLFVSSSDVVIMNNGDTGTSFTGTWNVGRASDIREYGDDSRFHAVAAGDYYQFRVTGLNKTAPTVVAIWWPRTNSTSVNRSSRVPIEVFDGDTSTTPKATYFVDEKSWDSSGWYYLGKVTFSSGISRARIKSVADGEVSADAVLWSKLGQGFKLTSSSPVINRGSSQTTSVVTRDFFGNAVPKVAGTAPDIGVHELQ